MEKKADRLERFQKTLEAIAKTNDSYPGSELAEEAKAALENRKPRKLPWASAI